MFQPIVKISGLEGLNLVLRLSLNDRCIFSKGLTIGLALFPKTFDV